MSNALTIEQTKWKALQFMVISASAFVFMNGIAKYLEEVSAYQITFFRASGSFLLGMLFLIKNGIPILGTQRKLLIARGISGTISMILFFIAIKMIPFGTTVSLRYLSPIFAAIIAIFVLKEKVTPLQWFCFAIAFGGVLLIKGFDLRVNLAGLVIILVSALFSGIVYVIIRKIGQQEHPVVIVNYFMFIAMTVGLILALPDWENPAGMEWLLLGSLGFFGFAGQVFMTKAYQIATIGVVGPLKYLEAVFALLIGWVWFAEGYSFLGFAGILLVVGGMLLNIFVKR